MAGARDRRQSPVAITEKGLEALNHDMQQRDAWLAAAMAERLSPTECEILRLAAQLMERLANPREES
jgi:DNA-binding MarR family transcriptional regulator